MAESEGRTRDNGLLGPLIIAAAIVITGGLVTFAIIQSIDNAKQEIIDATQATPPPVDPFDLHERIEGDDLATQEHEAESALHQAALAEESYRLQHQRYTHEVEDLLAEGLVYSPNVTLNIVFDLDRWFCIRALHAELTPEDSFYWDSDIGRVLQGKDGLTTNCRALA